MRAAHAGQAFDIDGLAHLMAGRRRERRRRDARAARPRRAPAEVGRAAGRARAHGGAHRRRHARAGRRARPPVRGLRPRLPDRRRRAEPARLRGRPQEPRRGHHGGQGDGAGRQGDDAPAVAPSADALWKLVSSRPADAGTIRQAIDVIDACGALDACEAQARALVEDAWKAADPLVPDSQFKIRLRAFGWFVLDRHY